MANPLEKPVIEDADPWTPAARPISRDLGRRVFGITAIGFGVIGFFWHDFETWQQLRSLWAAPSGPVIVYLLVLLEIGGGLMIQWRRTAAGGAAILGAVYLFNACRWIPAIIAAPSSYDGWGNFFEQFSSVVGASIVCAAESAKAPLASTILHSSRYIYGVCVVSFTLEQLLYLPATASLVPKWLPPSQYFWAVLTTVALALAAAAILTGRQALLASRLLTFMFVIFGLLISVPRVIGSPGIHTNWAANAQNLLLIGAAWIVADWLGQIQRHRSGLSFATA